MGSGICESRVIPTLVLKELEGLNWELVPGKRHNHLYVEGKMVTILPKGRAKKNDAFRNKRSLYSVTAIRRRKRELGL